MIVNTKESCNPGQHWLAIYFPRVGPCEFFDSLGHKPLYYSWRLERYLKKHGGYYIRNKLRYQQPGTKTCGEFCCYYLRQRCRGRKMRDILNDFDDTNLSFNEDLVSDTLDLTED